MKNYLKEHLELELIAETDQNPKLNTYKVLEIWILHVGHKSHGYRDLNDSLYECVYMTKMDLILFPQVTTERYLVLFSFHLLILALDNSTHDFIYEVGCAKTGFAVRHPVASIIIKMCLFLAVDQGSLVTLQDKFTLSSCLLVLLKN